MNYQTGTRAAKAVEDYIKSSPDRNVSLNDVESDGEHTFAAAI